MMCGDGTPGRKNRGREGGCEGGSPQAGFSWEGGGGWVSLELITQTGVSGQMMVHPDGSQQVTLQLIPRLFTPTLNTFYHRDLSCLVQMADSIFSLT